MRDMPINVLKCDCPQIEYSDPNLDQNKTNLLSPCSLANSSYRAFPPKKTDVLKAKKQAKFDLSIVNTAKKLQKSQRNEQNPKKKAKYGQFYRVCSFKKQAASAHSQSKHLHI